jgi:hypothetical protein
MIYYLIFIGLFFISIPFIVYFWTKWAESLPRKPDDFDYTMGYKADGSYYPGPTQFS